LPCPVAPSIWDFVGAGRVCINFSRTPHTAERMAVFALGDSRRRGEFVEVHHDSRHSRVRLPPLWERFERMKIGSPRVFRAADSASAKSRRRPAALLPAPSHGERPPIFAMLRHLVCPPEVAAHGSYASGRPNRMGPGGLDWRRRIRGSSALEPVPGWNGINVVFFHKSRSIASMFQIR